MYARLPRCLYSTYSVLTLYEITPGYQPFTILRKSFQNEIESFCIYFSSSIRFTVLFVCMCVFCSGCCYCLILHTHFFVCLFVCLSFSTVLAINLDFNTKLKGLVNELRGEIGATLKGSKDAKDRLLRSEYVRLTKWSVLVFYIDKLLPSYSSLNRLTTSSYKMLSFDLILSSHLYAWKNNSLDHFKIFHCLFRDSVVRTRFWVAFHKTRITCRSSAACIYMHNLTVCSQNSEFFSGAKYSQTPFNTDTKGA